MALTRLPSAEYLGREFADLVRCEPSIRELWVRRYHDRTELWLITDDIDAPTERHLYGFGVELIQRFPEAGVVLRILNPRFGGEPGLRDVIPPGSEQIPLRSHQR